MRSSFLFECAVGVFTALIIVVRLKSKVSEPLFLLLILGPLLNIAAGLLVIVERSWERGGYRFVLVLSFLASAFLLNFYEFNSLKAWNRQKAVASWVLWFIWLVLVKAAQEVDVTTMGMEVTGYLAVRAGVEIIAWRFVRPITKVELEIKRG